MKGIGNTNRIRIPPQNIESEKALLGSIMLRSESLEDVMDIIRPDSFYAEKHRAIFKAIIDLFSKNEPIDLLTLSSRLKEREMLDRAGGMSYLTDLVNAVPSSSNAEYYAQMVQKKHMMRKLIEASEHICTLGYDETTELDELLDSAEKKIYEVTHSASNSNFIELKDALGEAWDRLDKLHKSKEEFRGIPTGFRELDNKLAGLQKSDLIILAARPSMGKTSLALDIARQAAIQHNVPVAIFSLEMSSQQLVDRMLAAESKVDAWKLRTGKLTLDSEFEKIRNSLDPLSKAPIFVDDQPANNILKMRSIVRRLKNGKNLDLSLSTIFSLWCRQTREIQTALSSRSRKFLALLSTWLENLIFLCSPCRNYLEKLKSEEGDRAFLTLGIRAPLNKTRMWSCSYIEKISTKKTLTSPTLPKYLLKSTGTAPPVKLNYTLTKTKQHF